jgi:hypothetical protein
MKSDNPFFFSARPYGANPFRLLGVRPDDSTATIESAARAREQLLERGVAPLAGLDVAAGDFNRAAYALQDPLRRLAFDILAHCTED